MFISLQARNLFSLLACISLPLPSQPLPEIEVLSCTSTPSGHYLWDVSYGDEHSELAELILLDPKSGKQEISGLNWCLKDKTVKTPCDAFPSRRASAYMFSHSPTLSTFAVSKICNSKLYVSLSPIAMVEYICSASKINLKHVFNRTNIFADPTLHVDPESGLLFKVGQNEWKIDYGRVSSFRLNSTHEYIASSNNIVSIASHECMRDNQSTPKPRTLNCSPNSPICVYTTELIDLL